MRRCLSRARRRPYLDSRCQSAARRPPGPQEPRVGTQQTGGRGSQQTGSGASTEHNSRLPRYQTRLPPIRHPRGGRGVCGGLGVCGPAAAPGVGAEHHHARALVVGRLPPAAAASPRGKAAHRQCRHTSNPRRLAASRRRHTQGAHRAAAPAPTGTTARGPGSRRYRASRPPTHPRAPARKGDRRRQGGRRVRGEDLEGRGQQPASRPVPPPAPAPAPAPAHGTRPPHVRPHRRAPTGPTRTAQRPDRSRRGAGLGRRATRRCPVSDAQAPHGAGTRRRHACET